MRIGELAEAVGVSIRALRYYEQRGLLRARRQHNGYRDYAESEVLRVRNIRLMIQAGLDTDSIREIEACLDQDLEHTPACTEAIALFEHRIEVVESQLAALRDVHGRLAERLRRLRGDQAS
ncbi:MAG: MerR family transcriptional regulator [Kutzneria sp.]|nr:MerR family transcriptional regulator [Kutzneria sp.]MBV9846319.1 MerR family transcriptional regulator [Kutzneria sp.]